MANCEGCEHEQECREQVCLYDFYQKGREDAIKDADHWLYEAEMNNLNNKDFCLGLARAREIIWTCKTSDKEQKDD